MPNELNIDTIINALSREDGADAYWIAQAGCGLVATLLAKNADYGGSAWQRPALAPHLDPGTAILCRMSDKIARLQTLLASALTPRVNESIEDTLRDLAGYCLLYLARPVEDPVGASHREDAKDAKQEVNHGDTEGTENAPRSTPIAAAPVSRPKCANCDRQGNAADSARGLCPCTNYVNWIPKSITEN